MNKSRLLVILVAVEVLLAFATVGAQGFFGWTLPPELKTYEHTRFSGFSITSPWDGFRALLLAVTCLLAFASWIGLVTFWRSARRLYLVSCGFGILFILVHGAQVRTSVSAAFGTLNALVAGVILGLIYFSDLAHRFERAPAESAAPAGTSLGADRA